MIIKRIVLCLIFVDRTLHWNTSDLCHTDRNKKKSFKEKLCGIKVFKIKPAKLDLMWPSCWISRKICGESS